MDLAGQNLNALVALEALLTERSVGRAARRMGVSQSAMSHTLRQLRERLRDPLLLRVGNRMTPTPFAEALTPRLRRGLGELDAILSGRAVFDAQQVAHQFTLATHDGVAADVVGPLFARIHAAAPRASLRIVTVDETTLHDDLAGARCDAAIIASIVEPGGLRSWCSTPKGFSVVYRTGNEVFSQGVTLDAYCACPHLVMSLTGDGPSFIDRLLADLNRTRRVAVRVPYLLALPEVLVASDLVATIPDPVVKLFCKRWDLQSSPAPFEIPEMPLLLTWHERFDADPAQRFFRAQVRAVLAEFDDP